MARYKIRTATHIGSVEIPDTIVSQTSPCPYGLGTRLVPQKAEREIEAKPLAVVAIVRDTHDTSCVLPVQAAILGKNSQNSIRQIWSFLTKYTGCIAGPHARGWSGKGGVMERHTKMNNNTDGGPNNWEQPWPCTESLRTLAELNEQCLELMKE